MDTNEYFIALLHNFENIVSSKLNKRSEEANQCLVNYLLKLPGKRTLDIEPSKKSRFFAQVYKGYIEISESYERLQNYEIYVGRYGYSGTRIKRAQYLVYLVENYMNEIYVLNLRMNNYLKKLERLYKNDPKSKITSGIVTSGTNLLSDTYGFIIEARGVHIHCERYNDERLDRLQLLETLSTVGGSQISNHTHDLYKKEYKELRKTWKDMMRKVNKETEEILNKYFNILYPAVFTRSKNMRIPTLKHMPRNIESEPRVKKRKSG